MRNSTFWAMLVAFTCSSGHAAVFARPQATEGLDLTAVAWSRSGDRIATGNGSGRVQVWDAEDGTLLATFRADEAPVSEIAFGADDEALVTASGAIREWDAAGRLRATWPGRAGAVAFVADRTWAALADRTSAVSLTPRIVLQRLTPETAPVSLAGKGIEAIALALAPDGRTLAAAAPVKEGDSPVWLWDVPEGRPRTSLAHEHAVHAIAFSADASRIATGGDASDLRVWSAGTGALQRILMHDAGADRVHHVAFAPDGRTLYAGGRFFGVRAFDLATGARRQLVAGGLAIGGLAVSPDGSRLAALRGHWSRSLVVLDAGTGEEIWTSEGR
jgi:WD40 repeat protein